MFSVQKFPKNYSISALCFAKVVLIIIIIKIVEIGSVLRKNSISNNNKDNRLFSLNVEVGSSDQPFISVSICPKTKFGGRGWK